MSQTDPVEWKLFGTDFATVQAILPVAAGATLYLEINEPGSGSVTIPAGCAAAALVTVNKFIACYYRGAYRGGFLVDNIETVGASSGEHGDNWMKISGRGPLAFLDEIIIWPEDTKETTRKFEKVNAAYVVGKLHSEGAQRGAIQDMTTDFTWGPGGADSLGNAWTDSNYYSYTNGETVLEVLRDIAKLGYDFNMLFTPDEVWKFTLQMFKNPIGTDLSETIYFRTGVNCEELSSNKKSSELTNAYLIKYAKNYTSTRDKSSITSHRRREGLYNADEANAARLARQWGNALLDNFSEPRSEIQMAIYDGVPPSVFVDYTVGDTVVVDNKGTETDYRIRGMELIFDGEYAHVVLSLNTSFVEHSIRTAQEVERLRRLYTNAHDAGKLEVSYWAAIGGAVPSNANPVLSNVSSIVSIGYVVYVAGTLKINTKILYLSAYDTLSGEWTDLDPTSTLESKSALCVIGTDLYAAGDHFVHKWDGATWTQIGEALNVIDEYNVPVIDALATDGTNLYAGGVFNEICVPLGAHIPVYNVAKYNGSAWSALATGVGEDLTNRVRALSWMGTNLIAGGQFTVATSAVANYLAVWNGSTWTAYTDEPNAMVRALANDTTNLYVGGDFTTIGALSAPYVATWDGAAWEGLDTGLNGACYAIYADDVNVYVGGNFTTAGGAAIKYVAFWDGYKFYDLSGGTDNQVRALLFHEDTLFVGGYFANVGTGTGAKVAARVAAYIMAFKPLTNHLGGGTSSAIWGKITGDIDNQSDLLAELALKVNVHQGENSRVVVTDTGGHVTTDADLLYDAANNALTIGSEALPITVANALNVIAASGSLARLGFVFADTLDNSDYDSSVRAGGTFAAPTSILTDMILKKWRGRGYYNNSGGITTTAVEIRAVADGNWSGSSWPTRIEMWTIPVGSVTLTKALTVGSDGILYDGAGDPIGGSGVGAGMNWGTTIAPATIDADQDNYAPAGFDTAVILRLTCDPTDRSITGIAGGTAGKIITITNIGSSLITLVDQSPASLAANRISVNGNVVLAAGQGITFFYDGTESLWKPIASYPNKGLENPLMDGAADPGDAVTFSAVDHVHPSDTSRVPNSLFDAQTILAATTDNTPAAVTLEEQRVLGRITGGNITGLTAAQIRTLANVADGSQVNVLEGVTGTAPIVAGAIAAKSQAISISAATTGAAGSMSSADKTKLDGIFAKASFHALFNDIVGVGNVGGGEDDLFSNSIAAGQFAVDGDAVRAKYSGYFIGHATATRTIKVYFGGTQVFTTGALAVTSTTQWVCDIYAFRTATTTVRVLVEFYRQATRSTPVLSSVTGLTLTNAQILKLTGESAGTGGGTTNDIVAQYGQVTFEPAAT